MIKVNLLRNIAAAQAGGGAGGISVDAITITTEEKVAVLTRLVFVCFFPLCLLIWEKINISTIEDELAKAKGKNSDLAKEKSKYGDTGPRVERYNKDKARIDHQTDIIRGIARNRLREVKAFDALQSLVPKKAWLKSIEITGGKMKLQGYSTTDDGISDFIRAMEASPYFSHVEPRNTSSETGKTGTVKKFEIDLHLGKDD